MSNSLHFIAESFEIANVVLFMGNAELFHTFADMKQIMTLYHGNNVKVEKPEILVMGFYKGFGHGF